jgi:hypothetical protein
MLHPTISTRIKQRECHCIVRHAITPEERIRVKNDLQHKLTVQERTLLVYKLQPCPFCP